jgi:CRISPR-associated protein Cmr3
VAAAVHRGQVVSGWDLAAQQPKLAQRAVPAGSVYWLEDLEATPEALRKLAETGLWTTAADNSPRRSEGFNRFILAT